MFDQTSFRVLLCAVPVFLFVLWALFQHEQVLGVNKDLNSEKTHTPMKKPQSKRKKPKMITHFHYHAMVKTGSRNTRKSLYKFCKEFKLTCLSYCQCGTCLTFSPCVAKFTEDTEVERNLTYGYMTVKRMDECCKKMDTMNKLDAVVDHFPLDVPENREFIAKRLPKDVFRFTVIRNPVDQFVSLHHDLTLYRQTRRIKIPGLEKTINIFHECFLNGSVPVEKGLQDLYAMLTNAQSKFLGWDPLRNNMKETLKYLRSLKFVGLTEKLSDSWVVLKKMLRWPDQYFKPTSSHTYASKRLDKLSPQMIKKLERMQYADTILYAEAKKLFEKISRKQLQV